METKLFALKISPREKEAMDYVAKETDRTLSKVYYRPLQNIVHETLGVVLLHKIDRRMPSRLKDLKILTFEDDEPDKITLPIIEDFVELMINPSNRKQFNEIFEGIEFVAKDFLLYKLNSREIAREIGKLYLESHGSLSKTDLNLAQNIFFKYMLELYYKLTAIGSFNSLNTEWFNKRLKIKGFEMRLIKSYLDKYREVKAEAIEIEEVIEVSEIKD